MNKDIEYIHSDKYGEALKVAKKFTGNGNLRPLLTFVQHNKNGSIVATDSRRAIRISNIHGFDETHLIHPHTVEFAKGKFPETAKLFDDTKGETTIQLNRFQIKVWLQMHKSINQLIKKAFGRYSNVSLELGEEINFRIKGENEVAFKLPYDQYSKPNPKNSI
ncbi:hypothetical protein [Virgibacillus oceani]|uniref:Uncharacterized protein n=1 Tax=Virgibacillus oceani TaxID=1479511 RepID=A0A917H2A4_9BACI|nr:hypothetical protein [Virgibacillus oceani]GGG64534.1 hypothetical protein GCM10011398_05170 [Virgibacillus oceani]